MFSSTTSLNPFISSSPSSSYTDLSPYIIHHHHGPDHDHHNTYLLQHHQNPHSILPQTDHSNNILMSSKQEIQVNNGDFLHHQYGFIGTSSLSVADKRPPKKDRHSKIYTAQGLRDRRVRMSIEIARKFFDLQDLLGFDKASKTLEWLLNKSNKAIKELAQNDHINYNNNTTDNDGDNEISKSVRKMKKMKKKSAVVSNLQAAAKELREKARARARERTRNKWLCNAKLTLLNHPYFHNQPPSSSSKIVGEVPYSNTIGDSELTKRKLKQSTMMGYQQNLFFLKDENFPNLPPNWDHNSNSSAISSMNRPTAGVHAHLHGKIWEAENSKWL